jgi:hypothetical protein
MGQDAQARAIEAGVDPVDALDDDDLFEPAGPPPRPTGRAAFGPVFMAQYDNTLCSGCHDYVELGEDIRADGLGGWVHADDMCEELVLR